LQHPGAHHLIENVTDSVVFWDYMEAQQFASNNNFKHLMITVLVEICNAANAVM
jgi:hypothetical protein